MSPQWPIPTVVSPPVIRGIFGTHDVPVYFCGVCRLLRPYDTPPAFTSAGAKADHLEKTHHAIVWTGPEGFVHYVSEVAA